MAGRLLGGSQGGGAADGGARDGHESRVRTVPVCSVGTKPGDGGIDIVNGGREGMDRREAIGDGDNNSVGFV